MYFLLCLLFWLYTNSGATAVYTDTPVLWDMGVAVQASVGLVAWNAYGLG